VKFAFTVILGIYSSGEISTAYGYEFEEANGKIRRANEANVVKAQWKDLRLNSTGNYSKIGHLAGPQYRHDLATSVCAEWGEFGDLGKYGYLKSVPRSGLQQIFFPAESAVEQCDLYVSLARRLPDRPKT